MAVSAVSAMNRGLSISISVLHGALVLTIVAISISIGIQATDTNAGPLHLLSSSNSSSHLRRNNNNKDRALLMGNDGMSNVALEKVMQFYPNDWGVRFNKFPWISSVDSLPTELSSLLPFDKSSYPLPNAVGLLLQSNSLAHSVMVAGDYECEGWNVAAFIELLGGIPSMPSRNPQARFWSDFCQVLTAQEYRRKSSSSTSSSSQPVLFKDYFRFAPASWINYTLPEAAEAVHLPVLGTHHVAFLVELNKAGLMIDPDILPVRGIRDFIGREIRLMEIMNWSIGQVAPVDFWLKWTVGRPRPEEVAWKIATGELTSYTTPSITPNAPPVKAGVTAGLVKRVNALQLQYATNFTAFPEGSPPHPSWPAMHAAASAMSLWLPVVALELTDEQYCNLLRLDYAVAMARTVAGVHYPSDNLAGLQLGQELIARQLPQYLALRFGSDADFVQAKIEDFRFRWRNFDPVECIIHKPAATGTPSEQQNIDLNVYQMPCNAGAATTSSTSS